MKDRYHPFRNIDPFKIPETADKVLNEYWDIANDLKIKTFLFKGTCLGFVRDGGYIVADNDIDVGILGGEIEELTERLVKNGFECRKPRKKSMFTLKHDILLSVYFIFHTWEQVLLRSFDEVTYKGRAYNIPHPVEDYLKKNYGDWKIRKYRKLWER